jgi:hypothetical protein
MNSAIGWPVYPVEREYFRGAPRRAQLRAVPLGWAKTPRGAMTLVTRHLARIHPNSETRPVPQGMELVTTEDGRHAWLIRRYMQTLNLRG